MLLLASGLFLIRVGVSDTCGGAFFHYFSRFFDTVCRASELDLSCLKLLMQACFDEVLPPQDFAYFCDKVAQMLVGVLYKSRCCQSLHYIHN